MSQEVALITPKSLEPHMNKWLQYSLNRGSEQDFKREAYYLAKIVGENQSLRNADQLSIIEAFMNAGQFGLSLNPALKQAYIIPRRKGDRMMAHLEPSYMGLSKIMSDLGVVKSWSGELIYENDTFEVDLSNVGKKVTKHTPAWIKGEEPGAFVGVYTTAVLSDGSVDQVLMNAKEIIGIRDRSESWKRGQSGPWATDFGEMAKKTCMRRHFKTIPKSSGVNYEPISKYIETAEEDYQPQRVRHNPKVRATEDQMDGYAREIDGGRKASDICSEENLVEEQCAALEKYELSRASE
jgi:phage RecT family recombinase